MKFIIINKKQLMLLISIAIITIIISAKICYANIEKKDEESAITLNSIFKNEEKVAYLTFDDGPTSKVTPKVLDILKQENVKATFFVLGKQVKENPEIVKQAYDEGHYIANHGYSHNNNLLYRNKENFLNEIINTDKEIAKAIGEENYCSHIFRFPNGFNASMYKKQKKQLVSSLNEINYVYVDWNCLNKDSERKYTNTQLLENLKKSAKNKGTLVILMHDTGDVNNTYDVLKDSIEYLKQEGYIFKRLNFENDK